ncbi:MAG: Spy/CpxP family protein refolding chaperone [Desulfobacteraceae bacterium]
MKRAITVGIVFLLVGALTVPVLAKGPAKGRWDGRGGAGTGPCLNAPQPGWAPGLTEEQQARVEALYQKHFEETLPIRNELRAKRAEMRALLLAENLDTEKVRAVQQEIQGIRTVLSDKRLDLTLELRKIDPNLRFAGGPGFGSKGHRRGGRGHQGMGGYGGYGQGGCWN